MKHIELSPHKLSILLVGIFFAFSGYAQAEAELKFEKMETLSETGSLSINSLRHEGGQLYAVGTDGASGAVISKSVAYWQDEQKTALKSTTSFTDVAVSDEGMYVSGSVYVKSAGKKKTEELRGLLVKFDKGDDQLKPLWIQRTDLYPAQKDEVYCAVATASEKGKTVVYAAGYAASQEDNATAVLAKYDSEGNLLWSNFLGDKGVMKKSAGTGIVVMDDAVYVSGFVSTTPENKAKFNQLVLSAAVWKYSPAGSLIWEASSQARLKSFDGYPAFNTKVDIAASNGHVYLLSSKRSDKNNPGDLLILKYDMNGKVVWEGGWDAALPQPNLKVNDAWATGISAGSDRLYISGTIRYTDKLDDKKDRDVFILEVSKQYGSVLGVHFHGDRDKEEKLLSVAASDRGGYAAGDGMLLSFAKKPLQEVRIDVLPGTSDNKVNLDIPDTTKKKKKTDDVNANDIAVALLSGSSFNAVTQTEMTTLTFGATGDETSWNGCTIKDVDQDGKADLLCYFKKRWVPWKSERTIFEPSDRWGVLRGELNSGQRIIGKDKVRIDGAPVEMEEIVLAPAPTPAPVPVSAPSPVTPTPLPTPVEPPTQHLVSIPPPAPEIVPIVETQPQPQVQPQPEPPVEPEFESEPETEIETALAPELPSSTTTTPTIVPQSNSNASTGPTTPEAVLGEALQNKTESLFVPFSPPTTQTMTQPTAVPATKPALPKVLSSKPAPSTPYVPPTRQEALSQMGKRVMYSDEARNVDPLMASTSGSDAVEMQPEVDAQNNESKPAYSPELAREYGKMGKDAVMKGNVKEAISHFEEALKLDPKSSQVHTDYGLLLAQSGDLKAAAKHFEEALVIDPNDAVARENLDLVLAQINS